MKIANIAPPWLPIPPQDFGGTELVISYLVEEQVMQGYDITLLAPGDAKTSAKLVSFFPKSLIPSEVPWQAHLKAFYHLYKSLEYVKTHDNFDIVHLHLSSPTDMLVFPLIVDFPIPRVATLHSPFPFDLLPGWRGDADQFYMEWAPSLPVIAISKSAYAEVPHKLNFIGIIHHGIPTNQFVPVNQGREPFFAWLGRFIPEKGAHIAIEAAKRAHVPIVLAGTVDQYVQQSMQYFQQAIQPHIDDRQVKYIGPVDLARKIDLLSRASGLLNPILWQEPFGIVMIEAMALECPVISFARGAAPELIVHGDTGFLAENIDEMVRFIPLIHQIDRKLTRAHVELKFSSRVMAQKYVRLYQEVIMANHKSSLQVS
jgi:glycosyltransferase involved in cell wall biosynthesis